MTNVIQKYHHSTCLKMNANMPVWRHNGLDFGPPSWPRRVKSARRTPMFINRTGTKCVGLYLWLVIMRTKEMTMLKYMRKIRMECVYLFAKLYSIVLKVALLEEGRYTFSMSESKVCVMKNCSDIIFLCMFQRYKLLQAV